MQCSVCGSFHNVKPHKIGNVEYIFCEDCQRIMFRTAIYYNGAKYDLKVNPNKFDKIADALFKSENYCPCRINKTEDTKCICKAVREGGECICGLYTRNQQSEEE